MSPKIPYSTTGARTSLLFLMTESIVLLQTGLFHVLIFKAFLVTETERNHVMRRANSANRDVSCSKVSLPAKEDA